MTSKKVDPREAEAHARRVRQASVDIAICILTLGVGDSSPLKGTPEGELYAHLGMDMERWSTVKYLMTKMGWIEVHPNFLVTLTDSGRVKAEEVNKRLKGMSEPTPFNQFKGK